MSMKCERKVIYLLICLISVGLTTAAWGALGDGLIGYWPLNGDAQDVSGNGHHGTLLSGASFVANPDGDRQVLQTQQGAVDLGHVQVGLPASHHPGHMVVGFTGSGSLWVRFDDRDGLLNASGWQGILGHPPGLLYVSRNMSQNSIWTMVKRTEKSSSNKNYWPKSELGAVDQEDVWYHLAWTFHSHYQGNEGHFRWYVNGHLSAEYTAGVQTNNTSNFRIGADYSGRATNTKLAEVRLYDRILTAAEVEELASDQRFNPVPHYPLWWGIPGGDSLEQEYANGIPIEDYSPAVVGQLKYFADKARDELETVLAPFGGAGIEITELVDDFTVDDTDAALALVGQLKYVSSKFFDRFAAVGFTPGNAGWPADLILYPSESDTSKAYPWMSDASGANSPALLGQLKFMFSWDISLLSFSELLFPPELSEPATINYVYWLEPSETRYTVVGQLISLEALAGFVGSSVSQLEFYVDGALIGAADGSAPYLGQWTPLSLGDYSLEVRALSVDGDTVVSANRVIHVGVDSNNNGLADAWEAATGVISPSDDSDGDGLLASAEFEQGASPNAKDHPQVQLKVFNISY